MTITFDTTAIYNGEDAIQDLVGWSHVHEIDQGNGDFHKGGHEY